MRSHEIIKEMLLADADIVSRVGSKVYYLAIPQKVKLPAIVFKIKREPERTKDGIYLYKNEITVFGMMDNSKDIAIFEEEIINALEGKHIADEGMSLMNLTEANSDIQDELQNYYTQIRFEFR